MLPVRPALFSPGRAEPGRVGPGCVLTEVARRQAVTSPARAARSSRSAGESSGRVEGEREVLAGEQSGGSVVINRPPRRPHFSCTSTSTHKASLGTAISLGKYFDSATYGKIVGEKSPQPPSSHKQSARSRELKARPPERSKRNTTRWNTPTSHSQL